MKTTLILILIASTAGRLLAQTPPAPAPAPAPVPAAPATPAPKPDDEARPAGLAAALAAQAAEKAAEAARPPTPKEPVKRVTNETDKGMRLNFRGVPLEMVLNYFSEAAGFLIVPKVTDIRGRVDVWSEDPLTKDEAVSVLNNVLSRNNYAAFRSGRTLNIVDKDAMPRMPLPVTPGGDPEKIPATENMVTQILPIKFISAEQVIKNLDTLLPTSSIITANAGANALVITDTQINIKRVAEIVKALDTPIASVSAIKVFTLKFADAKALATVVKDLFAATDTRAAAGQQGGVNPMQQMFSRFGGGGGLGGGRGGGGAGGGANSSGRVSTPRVVASADELSNSLIVSAPEDSMAMIEDVVKQVDVPIEDVTEVKVFRLKYASADDTATMIKNLFPDTSTQGGRAGGRTGGGGFFGGGFRPPGSTGGGGGAGAAGQSERVLKQNKVVAVADNRTMSVIVTASPTLMEQITGMITQLDSDPSKQQKVFVIPVENADPAQMQQILQGLFPTASGRTAQSSAGGTGSGGFGSGTTTRGNGGQSNTGQNRGGTSGFSRDRTSGFGGGGFGGGSTGGGFGGGR
jgi:general secretion pathway protein D